MAPITDCCCNDFGIMKYKGFGNIGNIIFILVLKILFLKTLREMYLRFLDLVDASRFFCKYL